MNKKQTIKMIKSLSDNEKIEYITELFKYDLDMLAEYDKHGSLDKAKNCYRHKQTPCS